MATMMGHLTLTSAQEVSTESLGEASADAEAADGPWVVTEIIKMISMSVNSVRCRQKGYFIRLL